MRIIKGSIIRFSIIDTPTILEGFVLIILLAMPCNSFINHLYNYQIVYINLLNALYIIIVIIFSNHVLCLLLFNSFFFFSMYCLIFYGSSLKTLIHPSTAFVNYYFPTFTTSLLCYLASIWDILKTNSSALVFAYSVISLNASVK